jgi:hypothetical protein
MKLESSTLVKMTQRPTSQTRYFPAINRVYRYLYILPSSSLLQFACCCFQLYHLEDQYFFCVSRSNCHLKHRTFRVYQL